MPAQHKSSPSDFSWALWLLEGFQAVRQDVEQFCPPEDFWKHMHTAEREFLLAWRVLIEDALERNARRGDFEADGEIIRPRRQSIDVEF